MYDLFAGREALESSYFLTRSKALDAFPMLKKDALVGALVYYDGENHVHSVDATLSFCFILFIFLYRRQTDHYTKKNTKKKNF